MKPIQIYYRIHYFFRSKTGMTGETTNFTLPENISHLKLSGSIPQIQSYSDDGTFRFLNRETKFSSGIDWNFSDHGKLWLYNLNYFDFLNQKEMSDNKGLELINDFINNYDNIKYGKDPYPSSLRTVNWIKFLSYRNINDKKIDISLYAQYLRLINNLEYHLLGNHLLENGFSLLAGAVYFRSDKIYETACRILRKELEEQILPDGGHFELSPMYHQTILLRVLDSINILKNNDFRKDELLLLLIKKASLMTGWLENMTFSNGEIPLFNDSSKEISPTTKELLFYAKNLEIITGNKTLKESGYRKYKGENYEMIVDAGNIGPDYIPGHGHADMFTFELNFKGNQVIVDTGTSTYEICERRNLERSTSAHNTVTIQNENQSDVWAGFRVGKRAEIKITDESENGIKASHNGYKRFGIIHERSFECEKNRIVITDRLISEGSGIARFHFAPETNPVLGKNTILIDGIKFSFENASKIKLVDFDYGCGFNFTKKSVCAEIEFDNDLNTVIEI